MPISTDVVPARSQLDLLQAQVRAIDAWHRARQATQTAAGATALTREARLDLNRRLETRRREHSALVARVDAQLRASGELLESSRSLRAVVAHRSEWLCGKVCARLAEAGVVVVGVYADGADAAGTVVAEQPDIVLAEDRLPTMTGSDLVRRVRHFSPLSVVGAQVLDGSGVPVLLEAGAHAVFTRRVSPVDMVDQLLGCLQTDRRPTSVA